MDWPLLFIGIAMMASGLAVLLLAVARWDDCDA